jgi:hypothetical protein
MPVNCDTLSEYELLKPFFKSGWTFEWDSSEQEWTEIGYHAALIEAKSNARRSSNQKVSRANHA